MPNRLTWEERLEQFHSIHGDKYIYTQPDDAAIVTSHSLIRIYCTVCGTYFTQQIGAHAQGHGCWACARKVIAAAITKGRAFWVAKFREKHGDKYGYDAVPDNVGNYTLIDIFCPRCNSFFKQTAASHKRGNGCRRCKYRELTERRRISRTDRITQMETVFGLGRYSYDRLPARLGARLKVEVYCTVCHVYFSKYVGELARGHGCPTCAVNRRPSVRTDGRRRKTRKERIVEFEARHGVGRYDYSLIPENITSPTMIQIICNNCGHTFERTVNHHASGANCPMCRPANHTSKVGTAWLDQLGVATTERECMVARYRVDGQNAAHKVIYEFLGDFYHGHPRMVKYCQERSRPDQVAELQRRWQKTERRLRHIQVLRPGWTIKYIWEYDWSMYGMSAKIHVFDGNLVA